MADRATGGALAAAPEPAIAKALAALLARDGEPVAGVRTEMSQAAQVLGALTCDAVGGLLDRAPLPGYAADRLCDAIYALLRVAAAGGVADIDGTITRLIDRRNADRARLDAHGDAIGLALDRNRASLGG